jgi:hypothetical protein
VNHPTPFTMQPLKSISATRPVNPPGCSIVLSEAQLWAGLEIKIRHPTSFVETITYSELAEDHGDKVNPNSTHFTERESLDLSHNVSDRAQSQVR